MDIRMTSYCSDRSLFSALALRSYTPPLCTVGGYALSSRSCCSQCTSHSHSQQAD